MVLLLLSYLLYDDSLLFPKNNHGNEKAIGNISVSENDVRLKNNDNFIWLPGSRKDEVFNRDSIFTGEHSQAAVTLADGSSIQIQENSLVKLIVTDGQMQLDLRFGQLSGTKLPLRVHSGNEDYVIDGNATKFELNRNASGRLDVKVLAGELQVKSKSGKQSVKSNESLQISDHGEKSKIDANIELVTKDDIFIFRAKDRDNLPLAWLGHGPLRQYQVELSKSADFKKVLVFKTTAEQSTSLKNSLKEGTYFWRVKGLDDHRKLATTSEKHKFYLSYMPAPTILTPKDQSVFKSITLAGAQGLVVSTKVTWETDPRLEKYEWQLARTADYKTILDQQSLTKKELQTQGLKQGTYYTRVRGFDKDQRPSPWSATNTFTLEIEGEQKPPAPRLVEKRIRFQIPEAQVRAPSAAQSPQMAWSEVKVAKDYRWELAQNPRFNGAQRVETSAQRMAWTQYKPGKYYYRVYARTALGQMSDASEIGVLEVLTDKPVLNPITSLLVKENNFDAKPVAKEVPVKWSPIAEAKKYIVQVDKNADFSAPLQMEATDNSGTVTLPEPGKYFVRVKGVNEAGAEITEYSNTQETNYVFRVLLRSPVLIEPFDKTTVFLQKDMEPFIWLEWENVEAAQKYHLDVSVTPDFANPILSKELRDTRFLIKEKIPYGKIFWRVRALSEHEDQGSDWAAREFILYHQRNKGF